MVGLGFLGITLTGWVFLVVAVLTAVVGAVMFLLGSERLHYVWGFFCVAVCIWMGAFFMLSQASDPLTATYWWRVSYIGIILIPFTYFHFVLEYTHKSKFLPVMLLYSFAFLLIVVNLTTNLIVDEVAFLYNELYYNTPPAPLHPLMLAFFIGLVIVAHRFEWKAYKSSTDENFKKQSRLFFAVMGIGFIGATLNFLNVYGVLVHPITSVLTIFAPPVVAYAMLKYKLFNVRVVLAQFLTFAIVSFSVFRLAVSEGIQEVLFNAAMLGVTSIVGLYLIQNVRKEIEQREQIQILANELRVKNEKLTELDKLKSQFLSIATHELRTPLTIVRNFISLMLDGTYGKVNDALAEGGRQVFQRVDDMARSVDTYLNVSRIEQGKIKYDFAAANFSVLVETAYKGLLTNAEKKKLTLTLSVAKGAESIRMRLDAPKITEVLINLIDNSIKYTPKGTVHLSLERVGQRARFTISDTGVGMTEKTQQNLFKLFSPGEDSKRINPASTGVGLYVSKAHIEAHRGTLTAASEGPGKGSQFIVELPIFSL
jgi:signal transduction histidine kinase